VSQRWMLATVVAGIALISPVIGQATASAAAAPTRQSATSRAPTSALGVLFAPPCKSQANNYIVCFSIRQNGVGPDFTVHVGIDVNMSRQDAQNIIDAPGQEFSATLYGEDSFFDDTLKAIPVTSSWAWDGGLSAEFDAYASAALLDEDSTDPTDEIFARVKLRIPSTGGTRSFRTNNINEPFHLYR